MHMPIIKLEVQGMRDTIFAALSEHQLKLDTAVNAALDKLCTEEAIASVVEEEARRCIESALKEEVRNFFNYSNAGRRAIREAVTERLNEQFGDRDEG